MLFPFCLFLFCYIQVLAAVQQAITSIKAVVAAPRSLSTGSSGSGTAQASRDGSEGEGGGKSAATKGGRGRGSMYTPLKLTQDDALREANAKTEEFGDVVEEWETRVKATAIKQCFDEVSVPRMS
jgi:hypothetical protein